MKAAFIAIIALCCTTQLKAQQAPAFAKQQPLQQFGSFQDSLKNRELAFKMMDSVRRNTINPFTQNITINSDNMPVACTQGNSRMPVVQTDVTTYNMPVVGMNKPGLYTMPKPKTNNIIVPAANTVK
ncbi:hypothetical protein [Mucilaginibacter auburnensis]|uniref:Uncharacterized protein n=1 Tax=Mucilaginibacter auburnensis TaxID=1457233 RepID=A0A2H9VS42_9SPHI|nr:hypothetical protein [Mucilaginibacter auburnensis]PJJ83622.1 hypothetical protein CLV57_0608 [Mucilaginibacter auburnensis]